MPSLEIRLVALTRHPGFDQNFSETSPFPRTPNLAIYRVVPYSHSIVAEGRKPLFYKITLLYR